MVAQAVFIQSLSSSGVRLAGLKAQNRSSCSPGFVQTVYAGGMRGFPDDFGCLRRFSGYLQHYLGEAVQGLQVLGFSRFDHHRFLDDEREIYGGRMDPEIKQAFGNIQGPDLIFFLIGRG